MRDCGNRRYFSNESNSLKMQVNLNNQGLKIITEKSPMSVSILLRSMHAAGEGAIYLRNGFQNVKGNKLLLASIKANTKFKNDNMCI